MNIADKIKAIRKAKGITPTMMAKELGIEATNYPRFENRGNKLTYDNIESISKALGVTVIELLTWGESQKPINGDTSFKDTDSLNARIDELEERIKDKNKIIKVLEKEIKDVSKTIAVRIRDRIELTALQNNVGIAVIKYKGNKETSLITAQEYNSGKTLMPYESPYLYSIRLTDEELKETFFKLMKSSIFHDVMETVIHEGLLEDDELEELYMEYFNVND
ncbi:hypothetical protein GCM10028806_34910 [Spirosoma terrae]|uniref:Helix-turn-helix transcriptional regulator n=1 Tax=Spirosoma terrae TaxID=1968276 RepID=A0A6L9L5Q0_9BACT|nr:helix-turn-helix transcriptional regulator [Spirosoma terrae]NDU95804.1 helix-turn-helix transcriptional regulator [Spirosoma terrae]